MKRQTTLITFFVFCLFTIGVNAQKMKIRSVKADYSKYGYVKTSEVLLEVAEKGYKSKDLFEKLSNSLYLTGDMENAAKYYGELLQMTDDVNPEYYYRYAMALRGIEKYEESDKWMQKFNEERPEDLRGQAFLSQVDYREQIDEASREGVELINVDFNTENSDFGIAEFEGDKIMFSSAGTAGKKYRWNDQPFLDIYSATRIGDGVFENQSPLAGKINTKYHESSMTITSDEQTLYFTRNNFFKSRYKEDQTGVNRLQLFKAEKMPDGSWGNIAPLPFNGEGYSVAHPTVNKAGTRLYFASDMEGTVGQSDIFMVDILEDGTYGEPINIGKEINTEGKESFPYINAQGDLFFSSNGYPGLGGFDIFVVEGIDNQINTGRDLKVKNIGKPVNSAADDFAYYENSKTQEAYFSSNRPGGKGSDDIYFFKIPECQQIVNGIIKDVDNDTIIANAIVYITNSEGEQIEEVMADDQGVFSIALECDKEYLVRAQSDTFLPDEKRFTTPVRKQQLDLLMLLKKDEQEVSEGTDLATVLDIPIIYFDYDKAEIRYDAELELQKVLSVLNKYPEISLEIKSHTDSKGPAAYNEKLSGRRADATRQYLIDNGIDPNRLIAKGYGESQLVNKCTDDVYCTDAEHEQNRRSEFIIVQMNKED
jgi:outer membrane protein OmpA-like peptidoglycan-associated protein